MNDEKKVEMRDFFMPEDLISSYSREQAIDDGVLVDVSSVAKEMGIRYPVALSSGVFDECVSWSAEDDAKAQWPRQTRVRFELNRVPRPGMGEHRTVSLHAEVHGGDNGEPVVTVMLPNED